jgi:hypothetical protein
LSLLPVQHKLRKKVFAPHRHSGIQGPRLVLSSDSVTNKALEAVTKFKDALELAIFLPQPSEFWDLQTYAITPGFSGCLHQTSCYGRERT